MTKVKVAAFKNKLSDYLRKVRMGEQFVVTDRETPIARVIPYKDFEDRIIIPIAKETPKVLKKIRIPPALSGTDSLKALMEERKDDLEE